MILIGTTGFAYKDWVGSFYPKGTTKKEMLVQYARHFSAVEIVTSYYTIPSRKAIEAFIGRGGLEMKFVFRVHREVLNPRGGGLDTARAFIKSVLPVHEAGGLGALLLQIPWAFTNSKRNMEYLRNLGKLLADLPVLVEFRNPLWDTEDSYQFLSQQGWGFCSVDQPLLKGLLLSSDRVTARLGCVRLHGRNADGWWKSDRTLRYDYLYSREELREWLPRFRRMAGGTEKLFIFTANHYQGQAIKTARAIIKLLNG